jgi:putative ABC transport system permease protein
MRIRKSPEVRSVFFLSYLLRELHSRRRQAIVMATGLAIGIGLVITVSALSAGVRSAQGKVLASLYGVGTDISVTTSYTATPGVGFNQITPEPYVQHFDSLTSPTLGTLKASSVRTISGLEHVAAAAGALILTEIKSTVPADNAPPPTSFQPPPQITVVGVDVRHLGLGPFAAARVIRGRAFAAAQTAAHVTVVDSAYAASRHIAVGSTVNIAGQAFTVIGLARQAQASNPPDLYIPLSRAQVLSKLAGKVNTIYVQADTAAAVANVTSEISRQLPSATVSNSATLARSVTGSLRTTAELANRLGTWLAVLVLLMAFAVASLLTLAAVTRRGREFGTLKALGWRSRRISAQLVGETIATGIVGAAGGIVLGMGGAYAAARSAPSLSAIVQTSNIAGKGGFGGSLGAGGGLFQATIGGAVQTVANPSASHTVHIPFTAPVTVGAIVLAVVLAVVGALLAGSLGGWQISRLRPAEALASAE